MLSLGQLKNDLVFLTGEEADFSGISTRALASPTRRFNACAIRRVLGSGRVSASTMTMQASAALAERAERRAARRIFRGIR